MSSIDKLIDALDGFDNLPVGKMGKTLDRMMEDARGTRRTLEVLATTLRFYADPEIYKPHPHGPAFDRRDLSENARSILFAVQGEIPDA